MQYVGTGRRLVAWFLDYIIVSVAYYLVVVIVALLGFVKEKEGEPYISDIGALLVVALPVFYWVILQYYLGQTLGKRVMGIKVVDGKGQKPSLLAFFLREVIGKIVSAIVVFIGYLMIIWDAKKQGLHDKIAGTFVVKA